MCGLIRGQSDQEGAASPRRIAKRPRFFDMVVWWGMNDPFKGEFALEVNVESRGAAEKRAKPTNRGDRDKFSRNSIPSEQERKWRRFSRRS
jgi:hypothetical protein